MKKKVGNFLPKDFFKKDRSTITMEEALKDVIPVEWEKVKKTHKNELENTKQTKISEISKI